MWLVLIALIVFLLVRRWKIRESINIASKIQCGVKSYPLIGHAHLFVGSGANRMDAFQKLGRDAIKNGGLSNMWLGTKYFVVVVDPIDLEVIMKSSLEKDDIMRFARNLIGNGMIFAPVAIWRPRRKITAPTFSPKNLDNFVKIFARQSSIMIKQLNSTAGSGPESVWKYMTAYTLDSVCETTLGVKLNSQETPDVPFLNAFNDICKLIAARMVQPWLHLDAVYKLLSYHNSFEKNKLVICDFINKIIQSTRTSLRETKLAEKTDKDGTKCFLELLIEASGGEQGYSDEELLEEILVMMIAGTDTSAVGASFTISMLANNPDVQEKVFEELYQVFGDSDRPVDPKDLPHLKYLDAVLKETLRMYPPVPVIVREIEEELELPSGITLTKGCGVLVNIWAVHRNPKYWGNDAEIFRPERFIDTPLKHPAAFLAFSYGPRSCLGYQYAMMSMKTAVATFIRNYRVLSADDNTKIGTVIREPLKVQFDVMMKSVDGFRVKLVKRTKNNKV